MKRKKILAVVLVTLVICAAFAAGRYTGKRYYENKMQDVFQALREGRYGDGIVPGVEISPAWEEDAG